MKLGMGRASLTLVALMRNERCAGMAVLMLGEGVASREDIG